MLTCSTGETGAVFSSCNAVELFIVEGAAQPCRIPSRDISKLFLYLVIPVIDSPKVELAELVIVSPGSLLSLLSGFVSLLSVPRLDGGLGTTWVLLLLLLLLSLLLCWSWCSVSLSLSSWLGSLV